MNMNGPSKSDRWRTVVTQAAAAALCVGLAALTGCAATGALLYYSGLGPKDKVKAEFKLPPGPILILVDDDMDLVTPPLARDMLVDAIALQLKEQKISQNVTTNEEIGLIRKSATDFDKLTVREVGRRAKADTVIWMNVEDFAVESDLDMAVSPARFGVKLKVFNAREEDKRKIRLWPPEREGRTIDVTATPHEVRKCKNVSEVHQLLATAMADKIAKLFYDYTVEEK
jgi:hypothetical protein